jgi:hypothetical protein
VTGNRQHWYAVVHHFDCASGHIERADRFSIALSERHPIQGIARLNGHALILKVRPRFRHGILDRISDTSLHCLGGFL